MSASPKAPTHHIEGALLKRSKRGAWQKRYFSTKGPFFLYQRNMEGEFLGGVDLSGVDARVEMAEFEGRDGGPFFIFVVVYSFFCLLISSFVCSLAKVLYDGIRVAGLDGDAHSAAMGEPRALREFNLQVVDSGADGPDPSLAQWYATLSAMRVALAPAGATAAAPWAAPSERSEDSIRGGAVAEEVRRRRQSRLVLEAEHRAALAEVHTQALAAAREATARMIADGAAQRRLDADAQAAVAAELARAAAAAKAEAAAAEHEMVAAAEEEAIRRKKEEAAAEREARRRRQSRVALEAAHEAALAEVHTEALAAAREATAQMIADNATQRRVDTDAQVEAAAMQARAAALAKAKEDAAAVKEQAERDAADARAAALSAEARAADERRRRLEAEAAAKEGALLATKEIAAAQAVAMVHAAAAEDAAAGAFSFVYRYVFRESCSQFGCSPEHL